MLLFDFSDPETTGRFDPIGDEVMGGISVGQMQQGDGFAVFEGMVSVEGFGGFASVRSFPDRYDLSAYEGMELEVRGDGKTYNLSLTPDLRFDTVVYRARFRPPAGEWTTERIPFEEFKPTFRGDVLTKAPPLDPSRVATFGLLISGKQEGDFRLEIRRISAYRE